MQNVIYTKNSRLHKYKQYYTKGSIVVICGNEIIKKYKLIYNEIVSLASKNNKVLVITSYRNENRKESGVSFILNSIETLDFNIKNNITMKSIYYEQPVSIPIKFDIKSFEIKDKYDAIVVIGHECNVSTNYMDGVLIYEAKKIINYTETNDNLIIVNIDSKDIIHQIYPNNKK